MRQSVILLVSILSLTACKLETKSSAELLFPLGQHTWAKGEDYRNSPPSNSCVGCPEFKLSSPTLSNLETRGWKITLPGGETSADIVGTIQDFTDYSECGHNNDILCDNAWRVWPPNSGDRAIHQQTPGGDLFDHNFFLKPSFECGTSRFVLAAQNTYGTTRVIFEVERVGGVCDTTIEGPTIRVILKWNERNTDLDLHLVQSGSEFSDLQGDCHFQNCTPSNNAYQTSDLDWGVWGQAADNPFLDVDDDKNAGPENIFWYGAQDGSYAVDVHYHGDSTLNIPVLPDIEVWADGILVDWIFYDVAAQDFTKNKIWRPATITIQSGVVSVQADRSIRNF
jgi:hypothetical protein